MQSYYYFLLHFYPNSISFSKFLSSGTHEEMFSFTRSFSTAWNKVSLNSSNPPWEPKGSTPIIALDWQWQYVSSLRRQSQINVLKREIMTSSDWGESSYSSTTECLTTSVLILSPGSGHETADRLWKIHFISCKHLCNHGIPIFYFSFF